MRHGAVHGTLWHDCRSPKCRLAAHRLELMLVVVIAMAEMARLVEGQRCPRLLHHPRHGRWT